jgi:hypothetical protein
MWTARWSSKTWSTACRCPSRSTKSPVSPSVCHRLAFDAAWRRSAPAMVIKDKKGEILKTARGGDARYSAAGRCVLSVSPGDKVKAGDVLARIALESAKTRDITGGLPRVAELFEARRPKDARDHGRYRRGGASSARLQEQASHLDPAARREPGAGRVSHSHVQAHAGAGRG